MSDEPQRIRQFFHEQPRHAKKMPPRRCEKKVEIGECGKSTREGKPYCPAHCDEHPYIAALKANMERREKDDANAVKHHERRIGRVNIDGETAQDILMHLRICGPKTVELLSRELHIPIPDGGEEGPPYTSFDVINAFAKALKRHGLITMTPMFRGSTMLALKEKA